MYKSGYIYHVVRFYVRALKFTTNSEKFDSDSETTWSLLAIALDS